ASVYAPPPGATTSPPGSLPQRLRRFSPSPMARTTSSGARAGQCARARCSRWTRSTRWGAGDVFHGAFTLALAQGHTLAAAIRFAAAAAGLKCTRLGGSRGAPRRGEVEALLARAPASKFELP